MMTRVAIALAGCALVFGCVNSGREDPTELPESAEPTVRAFVEGATIALAFGVPLSKSGNEIDTNAGEDSAKGKVEDGLGGGADQPAGVVAPALTDPNCVTLTWAGLTVTVVYDACVDEDGTTIDGGLTLGLTLIPLRFSVAFDQLAIDDTTYDGSFGISFAGELGNRSTTIDANLSIASSASSESVQLDQMSLRVTDVQLVLDGAGSFSDAQHSVAFDATAVTAANGDCLPTSGTLAYDDGTFDVLLTFLPTTPSTGEVKVTSGVFETTVALLPPCQ